MVNGDGDGVWICYFDSVRGQGTNLRINRRYGLKASKGKNMQSDSIEGIPTRVECQGETHLGSRLSSRVVQLERFGLNARILQSL
jgi:hypothetical protein